MGGFINPILPHSDDLLLLPLLQNGKDHHFLAIVDDHKLLKSLVGHILPLGDKSAVKATIREGIKEIFQ
jgi:hypothetical protein